jgi:hypothetical protein
MAEEELVNDEEVQELADFLREQAVNDDRVEAFVRNLRRLTDLTRAQSTLVTAQGITKANDLAMFSDEAIEQIFQGNSVVARSVTILRKERLKGLAQWIRNTAETGDTDFTIEAAKLSDIADILSTAASGKKRTQRGHDGAKPISPKPWNGQSKTWIGTRQLTESYFALLRTPEGKSHSYVIENVQDREGNEKPIPTTAAYRGALWILHNTDAFNTIKILTSGGNAWQYVRRFEATNDGRGAWQSLCCHYQGPLARRNKVDEARDTLSNIRYNGKSSGLTIENFCNKFITAYNDLEEYSITRPDPASTVTDFLNAIQDPKLNAAKANMFTRRPDTPAIAIQQMLEQHNGVEAERRHVAAITQYSDAGGRGNGNRGSNGGGRGRGRSGRGRGRGRGGRGGRHWESDGHWKPYDEWITMTDDEQEAQRTKRNAARKAAAVARKKSKTSNDNADTNNNVDTYTAPKAVAAKPAKVAFAAANEPISGAGELFGSAGAARINVMTTRHRRITATRHVKVSELEVHEEGQPMQGTLACDSHADTCCLGKGWSILHMTDLQCEVVGFSDELPSLKDVDIVTGYAAYDDPATGKTYILHIAQALWLGHNHAASLICPNQLRSNGLRVDDIPLCFSGGKSLNGIYDPGSDVTLPFSMKGVISYLPIRTPSEFEYLSCDKIWLTSEDTWNPNSDTIAREEETFNQESGRKVMAMRVLRGEERPPVTLNDPLTDYEPEINQIARNISVLNTRIEKEEHAISTLSTDLRRFHLDPRELQQRFGGVSLDIVDNTLKATTQHAFRAGEMPLSRRYKTNIQQLRYRRLRDTWYSDTFKSSVKSLNGNIYSQIFTNGKGWEFNYPMKLKSEAPIALSKAFKEFGLPEAMVTDRAPELTEGEWAKEIKAHHVTPRTTEAASPWQNRAEAGIREHKKATRRIMNRSRTPKPLWDYCSVYTSRLRSMLAFPRNPGGRPGAEVMTGDTQDISEYLHFDWYQPVYHYDEKKVFPEEREELGRWLGPAHDVGQALCYWILKGNGQVVARTTVKTITAEDILLNVQLAANIAAMDKEISESIEPYQEYMLKDLDEQDEGHYHDREENCEDDPLAKDLLVGAEVHLPRQEGQDGGKETRPVGKVVGRKHKDDGTLVGSYHPDQRLDTRQYEVEFNDGTREAYVYNTIAQALYSELDADGERWYSFDSIVGHKKGEGGSGKTKGWLLEILWNEGYTTWETLSAMRDMNMPKCAEYAMQHGLADEPAFKFWVKHAIKKRARLIKQVYKRKRMNKFKYGIEVPNTVGQAYALDEKNGNSLWRDAIAKEMENVMVAFEIKNPGEKPPDGYGEIPIRMIFTIKMDFTRKARLVAGGHTTKPPETLTYASVVSRDSVRLAFLIAKLNDLEMVMTDIGNAFLYAPCAEKYYAIAGKEFGEMAGRVVVIVRALYGLKSAGASWNQHLAKELIDMKFTPCKADPDVWLREHEKADGTKYYEYVFVYTDDILALSVDPVERVMNPLIARGYKCKDVGPPTRYLGAAIAEHEFTGKEGAVHKCWSMSAEQYLKLAIETIETKLGEKLKHKKADAPIRTDYHPEIDDSELLDDDDANYYQSLMGILQWVVELGRIDVAYEVQLMASFSCAPRKGHMEALLGIFKYLKKFIKLKLVMDHRLRDMEQFDYKDFDWERYYPGAQELIPELMPLALGNLVQVTFFVDAAFATDLITRRSTTGIIIFVNGAPILWYSKRQATVETSTYGSEFTALRIAIEKVEGLRYKLRMMGLPLDGPASGLCDNQSVVLNSTIPSSTLKKKHNAVNYHKCRESIASGAVRLTKEPGETNLSDIATKLLNGPRKRQLANHILFQ